MINKFLTLSMVSALSLAAAANANAAVNVMNPTYMPKDGEGYLKASTTFLSISDDAKDADDGISNRNWNNFEAGFGLGHGLTLQIGSTPIRGSTSFNKPFEATVGLNYRIIDTNNKLDVYASWDMQLADKDADFDSNRFNLGVKFGQDFGNVAYNVGAELGYTLSAETKRNTVVEVQDLNPMINVGNFHADYTSVMGLPSNFTVVADGVTYTAAQLKDMAEHVKASSYEEYNTTEKSEMDSIFDYGLNGEVMFKINDKFSTNINVALLMYGDEEVTVKDGYNANRKYKNEYDMSYRAGLALNYQLRENVTLTGKLSYETFKGGDHTAPGTDIYGQATQVKTDSDEVDVLGIGFGVAVAF